MAKNYTYGWVLKDRGYVEVPESEYTERQIDMKNFIESMSEVIKATRCGWDGVKYKVMRYMDNSIENFMVLYCDGEALWYRKTQVCHFSKVCAFSAEKVSHGRISFCEHINPFCHLNIPPKSDIGV